MSDDYQLDQELLDLEARLAALVPRALPAEVVARVDAAVDHPVVEAALEMHDAELADLETHLGQLSPSGMSGDVLSRMVQAMDRWHEHVPVEEKVVPFGAPNELAPAAAGKARGYKMYAAAAAVALLGAAAALVTSRPGPPSDAGVADAGSPQGPAGSPAAAPAFSSAHAVDVQSAPRDAWLVPGSLSHKVTNTTDAGILMTRDNVPHRSIRIDYVDRIKVLDEDGREIEVARPGVQYVLIPVRTN